MIVAYLTELKDSNYKEFTQDGIVLVDIWAPWCGPCRQISPIVDQISIDFINKVKVGKLNADDSPDTITELGIRSIPTILLYKNGEIVDKSIGMTTKQKLVDLINNHL